MMDAAKIVAQLMDELEDLRQEVNLLKEEAAERQRVEGELSRTTLEVEAIFRALPDLKFRLEADGTIADYQAGQIADLYVPPEEFLGKRMQEVLPPEVGQQFDEAIGRVRETRSPVRIEYLLPIQDGNKYFEARLLPLLESEVVVVVRDTTERRHQEILRVVRQRVREEVLRMRSAEDIGRVLKTMSRSLEELEIPFQDCGINVVNVAADPPVVEFYTLLEKNMEQEVKSVGISMEQTIVAQMWRQGEVAYRRDLEKEDRYQEKGHFEAASVRAVVDIPFSHGTLAFNSPEPEAFSAQHIALMQELAEMLSEGFQRLEDLQRTAAEHERLIVTLRSIGDAVIATDRAGRVLLINQVAETLTGWTQAAAAGKSLAEVFNIIHEKTREPGESPVERVLEHGVVVGLANHTVLIARDGVERSIADSGAPIRDEDGRIIGVVLVFRDVTEQRRAEAERLRMQKLESVGLLAGGIAHDFNNILVGVMGNISLAKVEAGVSDSLQEILSEVEKSAHRARDLTLQLLTFSKGGAPVKETASLAELIRDSVEFALRGSAVQCHYELADDLWAAEVDKGQISQVVHNLVLNAAQAMPAGGRVRITATNAAVGPDELPIEEGHYVEIAVEDSGVGIAAEHLQSIFDPYFTTKQEGSGLGLATSYSIVKNHNGHLTARSELGRGSTFCMYLPAVPEQVPAAREAPVELWTGEGRVLVMDDEEIVRTLAERMLARLGYEVESAHDGAEALELYRAQLESGKGFEAVVMDLTIAGGMGGREAVKKILEMDPGARVIVSSGYSNDPIMSEYRAYGFRGVIAKPYTIEALSQALYRVVEGRED